MSGTIIYQKDDFRLKLKKHYTAGNEEIPVAVFYDDDGNQAAIEFEHLEGMFAALAQAGALPGYTETVRMTTPGPVGHECRCGCMLDHKPGCCCKPCVHCGLLPHQTPAASQAHCGGCGKGI